MAEKFSAIQWFLKELPRLQEDGLLDETSAVRLKDHYEGRLAKKPSVKNYFLLAMGIIGGLMVAAGIILVINYNWDMFSKPVRIGISAVPLLIGMAVSVFALAKEKSILLNELGAILTATGGATLIAMISQIYHIGGDFRDFVMLNLALSLPLIYIFNSIGLASVYTFGMFFIMEPRWGDDFSYLPYFLYILLILPYFLYHQIKGDSYRIWTRYLMGAAATFGLISCSSAYYPPLFCFMLAFAAWLAGRELHEKGERFFYNPWQNSGYVFMLILFAIGSCSDGLFHFNRPPDGGSEHLLTSWLFGILLFAAFAYNYIKRQITAEKVVAAVWLVLLLLPFVMDQKTAAGLLEILACITMVVLGMILLIKGYRSNQLAEFNAGFLLIAMQLICRFFDADFGLLYRAAGFIVLGIGFIGANVILRKKISREVQHEKA
ncbi:MAG: DUF2157 domain-containing protein [Lentisphaeria bacterium]|nr:DUF2157 domain-containing protein [Lentisphaeria bacterium]